MKNTVGPKTPEYGTNDAYRQNNILNSVMFEQNQNKQLKWFLLFL